MLCPINFNSSKQTEKFFMSNNSYHPRIGLNIYDLFILFIKSLFGKVERVINIVYSLDMNGLNKTFTV
jgi:hypothetical protein